MTGVRGPLALVILPEGRAWLERLPEAGDGAPSGQLAEMQRLVGGYIEAIGDGRWAAFLNEEGKLRRLPYNPYGDALARRLGWASGTDYLTGPVVFLGHDGPEEGDVPAFVLDAARKLNPGWELWR